MVAPRKMRLGKCMESLKTIFYVRAINGNKRQEEFFHRLNNLSLLFVSEGQPLTPEEVKGHGMLGNPLPPLYYTPHKILTDTTVGSGESRGAFTAEPVHTVHANSPVVAVGR